MGVGHEEIFISDNGLPASLGRAAMEGDKFPDDILVAHLKKGLLSLVSQELRRFSDGGKLEDLASFPNTSPLPDDHMGPDLRLLIDHDVLFNHGVGTDV